MSGTRQRVHEMIDRLAPGQLTAVAGLLEALLNGEGGEDEERAVEEARQWLRDNAGRGIPHEKVLADFGLTPDDFRRMAEKRAKGRG